MHAGFENGSPGDDSQGKENDHGTHTEAVEHQHERDQGEREYKLIDLDIAGIEDRNDQDRSDIVDDDEGEKHGPQAKGHAGGKQGGDAEGEGDIGRHGDGPALPRLGAPGR